MTNIFDKVEGWLQETNDLPDDAKLSFGVRLDSLYMDLRDAGIKIDSAEAAGYLDDYVDMGEGDFDPYIDVIFAAIKAIKAAA